MLHYYAIFIILYSIIICSISILSSQYLLILLRLPSSLFTLTSSLSASTMATELMSSAAPSSVQASGTF